MSEPQVGIDAQVTLEIPFQDCDPTGAVWHGNYFRYLEAARSALLDRIGYNYERMGESGYMWPIVDTHLEFLKPVRFPERIKVAASLTEYENRMRMDYVVRECASASTVARGYTIQVAVSMERGEMCFCSPDALIEKVLACADTR
jgi:acyl-CoA thioester hydrolase